MKGRYSHVMEFIETPVNHNSFRGKLINRKKVAE
jgi:hypothetical protein